MGRKDREMDGTAVYFGSVRREGRRNNSEIPAQPRRAQVAIRSRGWL